MSIRYDTDTAMWAKMEYLCNLFVPCQSSFSNLSPHSFFFTLLLSHPIITLLPTIPFPFWFFFSPLFHILPLQFLKFFLSLFNSPSPHLLFYLTLLLLFFQLFTSLFWLFFWPHYSTHYRYNSSNHSSPFFFLFLFFYKFTITFSTPLSLSLPLPFSPCSAYQKIWLLFFFLLRDLFFN